MNNNVMIVAEEKQYSLDCYKTKLNNNALIVGASGTGKTRSIVIPNLLQATGSYIVCDPKGTLYKEYGDYMRAQGYVVKYLDFIHPEKSDAYNPFVYLHTTQDVIKMADMIAKAENSIADDPFWDEAASLLVAAIIGYLRFHRPEEEQTFDTVNWLLSNARADERYYGEGSTALDQIMTHLRNNEPDCWAIKQYDKARVAAERTWNSILITLTSKMRNFDTEELNHMLSSDSMDICSIGMQKTVVFVVVSDSDRSMDMLVNLFFSQAMNELCMFADDKCEGYALPVPVRFILDDFATNCKIAQFPRMISSIRSRGISTMLMIQAESQLEQGYGKDGATIISNCDTYCYLGGTDLETARNIAERVNEPLRKVLYMPVGYSWVFRRGEEPSYCKILDLESFGKYKEASKKKQELEK